MKAVKADRIYGAIHEHIMQLRIKVARYELPSSKVGESIDIKLAELVSPIFRDVMAIVSPAKEVKPRRKHEH